MSHAWKVLTPIERLFVEGSDPPNQMNITVVFSLSQNVTRAWLDKPLARLLAHPRFRSRVVFSPNAAPTFVPEPGFCVGSSRLEQHVYVEQPIDADLPFPERYTQFMRRVDDIASDHIHLSAPLWRMHLFPAFSTARPNTISQHDVSTLVVKVHHAIADGLGLLKFILNRLLDPCDGAEGTEASTISAMPRRQVGGEFGTKEAKPVHRAPSGAPSTGIQAQEPASGFFARAFGYLCDVLVTPIALLIPDSPSALNAAPFTGRKRCAMLPASKLPLNMLRDTARAHGVTINDLLYAAVCATFERVLRTRGVADPGSVRARLVIPFNEHVLSGYDDGQLHNRFAFLFQPLHLDAGAAHNTEAEKTLHRLRRCADSMVDAKTGLRPAVSLFLTRVLARLPRPLKLAVWRQLTHACCQAFSNVPGPRGKVMVGGVVCESAHFFVPQEGELRVGVALLSYDGGVGVTVQADEARLDDPERFLDTLLEEVMRLVALAKAK